MSLLPLPSQRKRLRHRAVRSPAQGSYSVTEAGFALRGASALIYWGADLPFETYRTGNWLFLKCQVNEALGNCLAVTGTSQERLLNRNRDSQTAASWSNGLPFLGLASTSFTWIKFESRAMFLLDPGSDLEYRKHLAIYRCHKFLWCAVKSWGCCQAGIYQYGQKRSSPHPSPNLYIDSIFIKAVKTSLNKF